MLLRHVPTMDLVEALSLEEIFNPFTKHIAARTQAGEDTMDEESFDKAELLFPSGEPLPQCWINSDYRQHAAE